MKRSVLLVCAMCAICFFFVSCNHKKEEKGTEEAKTQKEINTAIIGVWKSAILEDNGNKVIYIDLFSKDGFFYPLKHRINPSGSPLIGKKQSYSFDGNKLIVGGKEKAFRLEENVLVLISDVGAELELKKTTSYREEDIKGFFK